MRRSEIDAAVDRAQELIEQHSIAIPPFARWDRRRWMADAGAPERMARGLGWDVTDFGRGDYASVGLCLCTLRNGTIAERDAGRGQTYAEKLLFVGVGQETPMHLHRLKTEDIINRGGGRLVVQLYEAHAGIRGERRARALIDGSVRTVRADEDIVLDPGESVTIPAGVFHRFWGEGEPVCAAEVSSVNDDASDNLFAEPFPRYPSVVEDVAARWLVAGEYAAILDERGVTRADPH